MKPSLAIAFVSISFSTHAQLSKNSWLTGGTGNFSSINREYIDYRTSSANGHLKEVTLSVSPNVGYFIADKFAMGLRTFVTWSKSEFFPDDPLWGGGKSHSTKFSIGPFARYYFLSEKKIFNILSEVSYHAGTLNTGSMKGKVNSFNALAGPVLFFNSSVGLEMLLGYSASSEEIMGVQKNSPKGFSMNIGFQIHLLK